MRREWPLIIPKFVEIQISTNTQVENTYKTGREHIQKKRKRKSYLINITFTNNIHIHFLVWLSTSCLSYLSWKWYQLFLCPHPSAFNFFPYIQDFNYSKILWHYVQELFLRGEGGIHSPFLCLFCLPMFSAQMMFAAKELAVWFFFCVCCQ